MDPFKVPNRNFAILWNSVGWSPLSLSAFLSSLLSPGYPSKFCSQRGRAFQFLRTKLFHILTTKQFQRPKDNMIKFVIAMTQLPISIFYPTSMSSSTNKILDQKFLREKTYFASHLKETVHPTWKSKKREFLVPGKLCQQREQRTVNASARVAFFT